MLVRSAQRDRAEGSDPAERLDGWKEIASYLKRDVRTVQRWEEGNGLPIHRRGSKNHPTVYAFRSELSAWWNDQPTLSGAEQAPRRWTNRERLLRPVAIVTALAVLSVLGWWIQDRAQPVSRMLSFQERDWVLIARFENHTGEPLLDGTLEYALERELSNSSYVNVVPRPRIEDALRLMKRSPDSSLDPALAREVCLRDGAIRALLTGRVEKLDSRYLLSVQMVDPFEGLSVAAMSQEAPGESGLLAATRGLASWTRATLGEALTQIRASQAELEKATTPSLKALQLFSDADALLRRAESPAEHNTAATLLREALSEDPGFAVAFTWLAWALANQGLAPEEYLEPAQKAFELSDQVSERERYLIQGSFYFLAGEVEKAIPLWEALLVRYPEDYWGNNNLPYAYANVGRSSEAASLFAKLAELRPNDFGTNYQAAWGLLYSEGDLGEALRCVLRLRELMSAENRSNDPGAVFLVELFPFFENWVEGDVAEALAELGRVEDLIPSYMEPVQEALLAGVGSGFASLGMLGQAEEIYHRLKRDVVDDEKGGGEAAENLALKIKVNLLAGAALLSNDSPEVGRVVSEHLDGSTLPAPFTIMLMARAGLVAQAKQALAALEAEPLPPGRSGQMLSMARAQIHYAEGNLTQTVEEIRPLLESARTCGPAYFLSAETLAQVFEQRQELEAALRVLDLASEQRVRGYVASGAFWLRNEWQRARLNRLLGNRQEAFDIEQRLADLLFYADFDHPILNELENGQREVATARPGLVSASRPQ